MRLWEAELELCTSGLSPAKRPTCSHKPAFPTAPDGEHGAGDPRLGPCRSPCPRLPPGSPKGRRHRHPLRACSAPASPATTLLTGDSRPSDLPRTTLSKKVSDAEGLRPHWGTAERTPDPSTARPGTARVTAGAGPSPNAVTPLSAQEGLPTASSPRCCAAPLPSPAQPPAPRRASCRPAASAYGRSPSHGGRRLLPSRTAPLQRAWRWEKPRRPAGLPALPILPACTLGMA